MSGAAMLRMHFGSDDIARTQIASSLAPSWELVLALRLLHPQRGGRRFIDWRRKVTAALRAAGLGDTLDLLFALDPGVPDLAPIDPTALRRCYELLIAPYHRSIEAAVNRDRAARMHALASGGVEGLFDSLRPLVHWSSGELRVPDLPDQQLHLDGRGLLLIPSYFCVDGPLTMVDPGLPPVLVYPVKRSPHVVAGHDAGSPDALRSLIGTTRAAVLEAIGSRHTTTSELAARAGISVASASEHTTILRRAGLVTSHRDRNRMLHHLTALGLALLDGPPGLPPHPISGHHPPRRQTGARSP